jgi:hypothetical protein
MMAAGMNFLCGLFLSGGRAERMAWIWVFPLAPSQIRPVKNRKKNIFMTVCIEKAFLAYKFDKIP